MSSVLSVWSSYKLKDKFTTIGNWILLLVTAIKLMELIYFKLNIQHKAFFFSFHI